MSEEVNLEQIPGMPDVPHNSLSYLRIDLCLEPSCLSISGPRLEAVLRQAVRAIQKGTCESQSDQLYGTMEMQFRKNNETILQNNNFVAVGADIGGLVISSFGFKGLL